MALLLQTALKLTQKQINSLFHKLKTGDQQMINLLLFQYKYLGSIALKCGASHFGFGSVGHFEPLQQLVIIFKARSKRLNFLGWLDGALDRSQYYHREVHHKGERLFLVFINTNLVIKSNTNKIYFSNFRQLCRTQELTVYKSNYTHPHSKPQGEK